MLSHSVSQSSFLSSFSYEEKTQCLDIQLIDGKTLRYYLVPFKHYVGMLDDECPGCYFKDYIQGQYNYEPIE